MQGGKRSVPCRYDSYAIAWVVDSVGGFVSLTCDIMQRKWLCALAKNSVAEKSLKALLTERTV